MENAKSIDPALLEEYKLCRETTDGLDRNIWQTATIFGAASVAGLITLLKEANPPDDLAFSRFVLGLLAIGILFTWKRLAFRWDSVKHAMILRMQHIERKFNLRANLYVRFLNESKNPNKSSEVVKFAAIDKNASIKEPFLEQEFMEELKCLKGYEYRGIQPMIRYAVHISTFSWLVLVVIPSFLSIFRFSLPLTLTVPQIAAILSFLFFLVYGICEWKRA